jgi:hypothetical protein
MKLTEAAESAREKETEEEPVEDSDGSESPEPRDA